MKKLLIVLLLATSSCVSLKTAKNIEKAEDKIVLYNKGVNNQLERYPELIDEAFTTIVYDTVQIASDSLKVDLTLQDSEALDSLSTELVEATGEVLDEIDSIVNVVIRDNPATELELTKIKKLVRDYRIRADTLFEEYMELSKLKNIEGVWEDDNFLIPYSVKDGVLEMDVKTKEDFVVVEKSVTTNKIDIRKDFWQDGKFWFLFIIPLLALIYLLGDKLQDALQSMIQVVIKTIRKLITGGI